MELKRLASGGRDRSIARESKRGAIRAPPPPRLIVAGDVATNLELLSEALIIFRSKFKHVFFCPGNHELWVMLDAPSPNFRKATDSVDKFFQILSLCDELGVHTSPAFVGETVVLPIFSWYKRSGGAKHAGVIEYFDGACAWPWPNCASSLDEAVADFFLGLNEGTLEWLDAHRGDAPVISFSHFLPRVDSLFPGFLAFRHVMGCGELTRVVDRIQPRVHCFGHSHINVDEIIKGTRFVQQALGHPSDGISHADDNTHPLLVWCAATMSASTSPISDGSSHQEWLDEMKVVFDYNPPKCPGPDESAPQTQTQPGDAGSAEAPRCRYLDVHPPAPPDLDADPALESDDEGANTF